MHQRETQHAPSPSAFAYDLGEVTIHLLPVDPSLITIATKRLEGLYEAAIKAVSEEEAAQLFPDGAHARAVASAASLGLFACWDAATLAWDFDGDPDDVLFLEGEALVTAAEACRREALKPSTARLGVGPKVWEAWLRLAIRRPGLTDEAPAPGEDPPAES